MIAPSEIARNHRNQNLRKTGVKIVRLNDERWPAFESNEVAVRKTTPAPRRHV
jgi:hypothetical protein